MPKAGSRGASSVIGVVLLVAITVVLASTIAGFVFVTADGSTSTPPPRGAFSFDYAEDGDTRENVPSDNLTITYEGGEDISGLNLNFTLSGAREMNQSGGPEGTDDLYIVRGLFKEETVTAGSTEVISENNVESRSGGPLGTLRGLDLQKAVVRVYWDKPDAEQSSVITVWRGPKA